MVEKVNKELNELMEELDSFKSSVEYLDEAKLIVTDSIEKVNSVEDNFNDRIRELQDTYDAFMKLNNTTERVIKKLNTINFPDRLDNIEEGIKSTVSELENAKKETLGEVEKAAQKLSRIEFDRQFDKIFWEVNKAEKMITDLSNTIDSQKLPERLELLEKDIGTKFSENAEKYEKLINQAVENFVKMEIPVQIKKIQTAISGINTGIQTVHRRQEAMEDNLRTKIDSIIKTQEKLSRNLSSSMAKRVRDIEDLMNKNFGYQRVNTLVTWILVFVMIGMIVLFTFDFI